MDEHVNSISNAYQNYLDAANAMLAVYHSQGSRQIESTNLALENLTERRKHFVSACDKAEGFIDMMSQQVRELEVPHLTEAIKSGTKNLHCMRNLLSLSCETLTRCFDVMTHQVRKLEAAELIYLEDVIQDGDGAHVAGEGNTSALLALSGIDTKRDAPDETVDHNTDAPDQETVEEPLHECTKHGSFWT